MTDRKMISVRMPEELVLKAQAQAESRKTTITEVVLEALRGYLEPAPAPTLYDLIAQAAEAVRMPQEPVEDDFTPEQKKQAREAFNAGKGCIHCGGLHLRYCPRVKRIVFHGNEPGEVEYFREGTFTWPDEVIWPEDVQE